MGSFGGVVGILVSCEGEGGVSRSALGDATENGTEVACQCCVEQMGR